MTKKTYNRLLELGIMLAKEGYTVILDAKYDLRELRQQVISQAQEQHIPLHIIYCSAPVEVLRDRLAGRTKDISDATPDLLAQQQANAEGFSEMERDYVITIDTTQPDWRSHLIQN